MIEVIRYRNFPFIHREKFKVKKDLCEISNIVIEEDIQEITLFFEKVKPAILLDSEITIKMNTVESYFYIPVNYGFETAHLLCHDEESKINFLSSKKDTLEESNRLLGTILGYPPAAVEDFIKLNKSKNYENWLHINYHGIIFGCYKESVSSCTSWLEEKYQIPSFLQTGAFYYEQDKKIDLYESKRRCR